MTRDAFRGDALPQTLEVNRWSEYFRNEAGVGLHGPTWSIADILGKPVDMVGVDGKKMTFLEVNDHLRVVFDETVRNGEAVVATEQEAKPGQKPMTVLKSNPRLTLDGLRDLTVKIRAGVKEDEGLGMDGLKTEKWFRRMNRVREKLANTACAMRQVQLMAGNGQKPTSFDEFYGALSNYLFDLAKVTDSDGRYSFLTLDEALEEKKLNDTEGLLEGLKYARFGMVRAGRDFGKKGEPFERMARVYQKAVGVFDKGGEERRLGGEKLGYMMRRMVIETTFGEFFRLEKQMVMVPIEAVVRRGIENLYQELPIPEWIESYMVAATGEQRDEVLKQLDPMTFKRIAYEVTDPDFYKILLAQGATGIDGLDANQKKLLGDKMREYLVTMGLGGPEVRKFSQWFESGERMSAAGIGVLKGYAENKNQFFWEGGLSSKGAGIKDAVGYYQLLLERARSEGEKRAILTDLGRFQRAVTKMTISAMRFYKGWGERDMGGMIDSAPALVLGSESMNCVGRSIVLSKCAMALGLDQKAVFSMEEIPKSHSSLLFFFADGRVSKVEPSSWKSGEFGVVDSDLLKQARAVVIKKGEYLGIKMGDQYASVFEVDRGLAGHVMNQFIYHMKPTEDRFEFATALSDMRGSFLDSVRWFEMLYYGNGSPSSFGELKEKWCQPETLSYWGRMEDNIVRLAKRVWMSYPNADEFLKRRYPEKYCLLIKDCQREAGEWEQKGRPIWGV